MRLAEALRVGLHRTIAFTGAGGKSTAIGRLVTELREESTVVVTTTTKIAHLQSAITRAHLVAPDIEALEPLRGMIEEHRSVLVTGGKMAAKQKWMGIDGELLNEVQRISKQSGALLLIEADGARGCSLKAPAPHEPVVPPTVDLVVPVAGLDAVGQPLDSLLMHRSERVAALLGLSAGNTVEAEHVSALLCHPEGGLKGTPPPAAVRVLLNKAESPQALACGASIASALLTSPRIQAAVLAASAQDPPVRHVFGRVAGVILAAGGSRRLGRSKQLAIWKGKPLVSYAVQAALKGGLSPIVVVLGAESAAVRRALENEDVAFVQNSGWASGQSSSLRAGLAAVREKAEAVMFLLSDMPLVTAELVRALVTEHGRTLAPIVAPRAAGRRANPVLFDRVTYPALDGVTGDRGGRSLFGRFRTLGIQWDSSALGDVDTPEDLEELRKRGSLPR